MKYMYSPSTGGIYFEKGHGDKMPDDVVEISKEDRDALVAGLPTGTRIEIGQDGRLVFLPPPLTDEQKISEYEAALDTHLDAVAQQHRYNDRFTFAMRAGYPGPWQAAGTAFGTWMDTCNAQAYSMLQDIQSGIADMPTVEEFIAELPPFVLP